MLIAVSLLYMWLCAWNYAVCSSDVPCYNAIYNCDGTFTHSAVDISIYCDYHGVITALP